MTREQMNQLVNQFAAKNGPPRGDPRDLFILLDVREGRRMAIGLPHDARELYDPEIEVGLWRAYKNCPDKWAILLLHDEGWSLDCYDLPQHTMPAPLGLN